MKTLAVIMQKGGSGKSTVAVHLAAYTRGLGQQAALIDIDPQANSFNWNESRQEDHERYPKLIAAKAEARDLKNLLREAKQAGCDLAVIDSAPHSNAEAALACQVADFILIPCRPARFDLEAFETTIQIVKASRKPFAVVINAAPRGRIAQEAQELLKTTYNVNVLPTILHHRAAYSHAVIDGRAVSEFEPDGKAAHEITALHRDITALWSDTRR